MKTPVAFTATATLSAVALALALVSLAGCPGFGEGEGDFCCFGEGEGEGGGEFFGNEFSDTKVLTVRLQPGERPLRFHVPIELPSGGDGLLRFVVTRSTGPFRIAMGDDASATDDEVEYQPAELFGLDLLLSVGSGFDFGLAPAADAIDDIDVDITMGLGTGGSGAQGQFGALEPVLTPVSP